MRAVITGAAGGIGAAIARTFAESGRYRGLVLVDRDAGGLERAAADLRESAVSITTLTCNLASADAGDLVIEATRAALGGLDTLVSNAGLLRAGSLATMLVNEYDLTAAVNTRATWLLARAAYPLLKESQGSVVVTASLGSEHPTPGIGAYSASKAGVVMLVKQLAYEWGPDGIRANCVSPGAVQTPMTAAKYADPASDDRRAREAIIPLRRLAAPAEVASVVDFLASPAASYVSGVNLFVDGGWSTALCRP